MARKHEQIRHPDMLCMASLLKLNCSAFIGMAQCNNRSRSEKRTVRKLTEQLFSYLMEKYLEAAAKYLHIDQKVRTTATESMKIIT